MSHLSRAPSARARFDPSLVYAQGTIGYAQQRRVLWSAFTGADPTGVADGTATLNLALSAAAAMGCRVEVDGWCRITSTIVPPRGVIIEGAGKTSDPGAGLRGRSALLKAFAGVGVLLSNDDAGLSNIHVANITGQAGDNIQLTGSRCFLRYVTSTGAGAHGLRVGDTVNASQNTNLWRLDHVISIYNTGSGIVLDDPIGSTDAGGGVLTHCDVRSNGADGIVFGNTTWVSCVGLVAQNNAGIGARITAGARSVEVFGGDLEGNLGAFQGVIEAGSFGHRIAGAFYNTSGPPWVDNSGFPQRNVLSQYRVGIGRFVHGSGLSVADPRVGGEPKVEWFADVGEGLVATMIASQEAGGTGGKVRIQTKRDGSVETDAVVIDQQQRVLVQAAFAHKLIAQAYSASITINAATGDEFEISANSGAAFTINAPTSPSTGQRMTVTVRNTSGGVLGAATWNAVFKMAAWVAPATGNSRSVTFRFNGANWVEVTRTTADVPN